MVEPAVGLELDRVSDQLSWRLIDLVADDLVID
jgi:hypothetical protein